MHVSPSLQRRRALRWLAPVGVVSVAGLAVTGVLKSTTASSESLPPTTPAALIAAVQMSDADDFSGTVVSRLSLGLPDLPAIGNLGDGPGLTSLLSGSHTLQVWYGGIDKQRVALLGSTEETDVFRNGTDVWQWNSADEFAVHASVPALGHGTTAAAPSAATASTSLMPVDLARRALGALEPSTQVVVEENYTVADRSAYELVLTPRAPTTKVGSVHIAIDGQTKVPLGVQIYPRHSQSPAVDVAFTSIRFAPQANRNFVFSPPPGATVRDLTGADAAGRSAAQPADAGKDTGPTITGSGWATVVGLRPGKAAVAELADSGLLKSLTPVSGSWGKGRLLDASLLSLLVTDDGRLFVGAVEPAELYAAAGSK